MPAGARPIAIALALAAVAVVALAGCLDGDVTGDLRGDLPDDRLPGVRTEMDVTDAYACGALLVPVGCTALRVQHVESGCVPEVGGYVVCDARLHWMAESGAVAPGSRLLVHVNGTPQGSCTPQPEASCTVHGNASYVHHFGGPGEHDTWRLALYARLDAPGAGDAPAAEGWFRLGLAMAVRTEPASALAT